MRRVLTVIMLVVLFGSIAQAEDSAALMARLQRANDLTRLDNPTLKPWHLKANFQLYDAKGKPAEQGTLEEWWAGPSLWKRVYTSATYTATQIANKDGFYTTPKVGPVPELLELVERQYVHPMPEEKDYSDTVPELRKQNFGKFEADCIMLDLPMKRYPMIHLGFYPTYCFDRDKDTLRSTTEFGSRVIARNQLGLFQARYVGVSLSIWQDSTVIIKSEVTTLHSETLSDADFVPSAALEKIIDLHTLPVPLLSGVMAGMILTKTQPPYPQAAKDRGVSGDVLLRVVIGKDGHIRRLRYIGNPDPDLALAAFAAVRRWTYKPYLLNGVPVEIDTQITVKFTLGG
jgi:TonB family protein